MVKASQKILALCLCLALMMSIVPAAFAEAGSDFDSLQIGDSAAFDVAEGVIATVDGTGCKSIEEISAAAAGGSRLWMI